MMTASVFALRESTSNSVYPLELVAKEVHLATLGRRVTDPTGARSVHNHLKTLFTTTASLL